MYNIFSFKVLFLVTIFNCCPFAYSVCCPNLDNECFDKSQPYIFLPEPQCPTGSLEPRFDLYTRENKLQKLSFRIDTPPWEKLLKKPFYYFFIHGWKKKTSDDRFQRLKNALLEKDDAYVFLVDWYEMAKSTWYPQCASNTRTAGAYVALLWKRIKQKDAISFIWCAGHSLGAHVCGHAGQRKKIVRITGLDPAGPFFQGILDNRIGLSKDDAQFVDVIHTNAVLGTYKRLGHADYYPNGGRIQPACSLLDFVCQHEIATDYLTDSITNKCKADSWCTNIWLFAFTCKPTSAPVYMGYHASGQDHAAYYVSVTDKPPYC